MAEDKPTVPAPEQSVDAGKDSPGDQGSPEKGHETSDVDVRVVLWFGTGLTVALVVVSLVLAGMFGLFRAREDVEKASDLPLVQEQRAGRPDPRDRLPSGGEPRLEGIVPEAGGGANWPAVPLRSGVPGWESNAQELARRDQERLKGYGWVDRDKGVAHIPIDRAIDITAAELQQKKGK